VDHHKWQQTRARRDANHITDEQIPCARELSAAIALNFLTVNKVYVFLDSEGLLEVRRGLGSFVEARSAEKREADRLAYKSQPPVAFDL
jgi:DNA-binding transcriptional regulator YhcF (GntR family)